MRPRGASHRAQPSVATMSSACEFIKFGGCLGFSSVFLIVLLNGRDIISAVLEASVACVVVAMVFKLVHNYALSLKKRSARAENHEQYEEETDSEIEQKTLMEGQTESQT